MDETEQETVAEMRQAKRRRRAHRRRSNRLLLVGILAVVALLLGGVLMVGIRQSCANAEKREREAESARRAAHREALRLQREVRTEADVINEALEKEQQEPDSAEVAPEPQEPSGEPTAEQETPTDAEEPEPAAETPEQKAPAEPVEQQEKRTPSGPVAEETRQEATQEKVREKTKERQEESPAPEKKAAEPKNTEQAPETKEEKPSEEPLKLPPLVGAGAQTAAAAESYQALVAKLLNEGEFRSVLDALRQRLGADITNLLPGHKFNQSAYRASRTLSPVVDLCLLAEMVPEDELRRLLCDDKKERDFGAWLLSGKDQPLHKLLLWQTLEESNGVNLAYALRTLYSLWQLCPSKDLGKYENLMVACSLLHPEVANAPNKLKKQVQSMTIQQVFTYFTEADAKHRLLTDIHHMSVERLLHVVDFRLPRSEVDWVQKSINYKRSGWGETYEDVDYMMERATANKDPYKEYTFAEILKLGGVCRDQAYYCGTSAKCKGIPAIFVTGDGDRGPHAWVVLLVDDNTWTQVNNYGYTTGRFLNPCSGRSMHASVYLSQTRQDRAERIAPAGDGMMLSHALLCAGAIQYARDVARWVTNTYPALSAAWRHLVRVTEWEDAQSALPAETWKKLDDDLMRAASKNAEMADMAGELEEKHMGGTRRHAVQETKRKAGDIRTDVIMAAVDREARALADVRNYNGLEKLYKKQLTDYADRVDVFEQLTIQYMGFLEGADAHAWSQMAKTTEGLYNKKVCSKDSSDYFRIAKEISIQKLIAQAWGKAGNKKKSEKLQKEARERLEAAREKK